MKNIIVLFGKPGAGKGTRVSEFLVGREELYEVLSVGNLLRKARKEQTELGKKAESYMDSGALVPDEIINEIVIEGIKTSNKNVFLDGYPRTVGQAKAMLKAGIYPDKVVNFDVSDEVVLQRARDRIVCEKCGEPYTTNSFKPPKKQGYCDKCGSKLVRRADDDEKVVRQRLQVYQEQTCPVLNILMGNYIKIYTVNNAQKDADKKFAEIMEH